MFPTLTTETNIALPEHATPASAGKKNATALILACSAAVAIGSHHARTPCPDRDVVYTREPASLNPTHRLPFS